MWNSSHSVCGTAAILYLKQLSFCIRNSSNSVSGISVILYLEQQSFCIWNSSHSVSTSENRSAPKFRLSKKFWSYI
jgi:hypothetical protein